MKENKKIAINNPTKSNLSFKLICDKLSGFMQNKSEYNLNLIKI